LKLQSIADLPSSYAALVSPDKGYGVSRSDWSTDAAWAVRILRMRKVYTLQRINGATCCVHKLFHRSAKLVLSMGTTQRKRGVQSSVANHKLKTQQKCMREWRSTAKLSSNSGL